MTYISIISLQHNKVFINIKLRHRGESQESRPEVLNIMWIEQTVHIFAIKMAYTNNQHFPLPLSHNPVEHIRFDVSSHTY